MNNEMNIKFLHHSMVPASNGAEAIGDGNRLNTFKLVSWIAAASLCAAFWVGALRLVF